MMTDFTVVLLIYRTNWFRDPFFTEEGFAMTKTVMEINLLRGTLCTITDMFFQNPHGGELSFFSPDNRQS